jgi:hypothetical protein
MGKQMHQRVSSMAIRSDNNLSKLTEKPKRATYKGVIEWSLIEALESYLRRSPWVGVGTLEQRVKRAPWLL